MNIFSNLRALKIANSCSLFAKDRKGRIALCTYTLAVSSSINWKESRKKGKTLDVPMFYDCLMPCVDLKMWKYDGNWWPSFPYFTF